MVFAAATRGFHFYWDNIPDDTVITVGQSALYTFAICLIFRNPTYFSHTGTTDLNPAFKAAGIAACASLVHALVTPIFNYLFGDNEILPHREYLKRLTVVIIVILSVQYATTSKINLVVKDFFRLFPLSLVPSTLRVVGAIVDYLRGVPTGTMFPPTSRFYAQPGSNSIYLY
jgi:hypothetical protein